MTNTLGPLRSASQRLNHIAVALAAGWLTVSFTQAQWSVREDFPNGDKKGTRYSFFTKERWNASNYAPPQAIKRWEDHRYGMFLHFGITSKDAKDLSWGTITERYAPDFPSLPNDHRKRDEGWTTWPLDMKLEKFNAKEWVEIARKAGMRYIVVITKHHEGFHMWDTELSDFKITKTPFGRDYLKELADACAEAHMPLGFYFSQREWYHPDYMPVDLNKVEQNGIHWKLKPGENSPVGDSHKRYLEYCRKAIKELCTQYGTVDCWWWDAADWGGMFTEEMWDGEEWTRMMRELQPGIVINNRAGIPGDYDTAEAIIGSYQDWRSWESCFPLDGGWSYSARPPRPFNELIKALVSTVCGNGNFLCSWGPKWDGSFDEAQKQRLFEVGEWLGRNGDSIYGTRGGPWKPASWGGSTRNGNKAYVHLFGRKKGPLVLPRLDGRAIQSAFMLESGELVPFRNTPAGYEIDVPAGPPVRGSLVVALVMDRTLDGLPAVETGAWSSQFAADPLTYGAIISRRARVAPSSPSQWSPKDGGAALVGEEPVADFAIHTAPEQSPYVDIDLGEVFQVAGLKILNAQSTPFRMATLRASVSEDGAHWTEVWRAEKAEAVWEAPVTEFRAGALLPGRNARFIRLQTHPESRMPLLLRQVEVWGRNAIPPKE